MKLGVGGGGQCGLEGAAETTRASTCQWKGIVAVSVFVATYDIGSIWGGPKAIMAPHSSTPAWKIPWVEEPGKL